MTNSQPIATPQSINFTPDNKQAYAYSGTLAVAGGTVSALLFNTNSEYIIAQIEISFDITGLGTGEDIGYQIKLNDVEIIDYDLGSNVGNPQWFIQSSRIIIPPFTKFEGILYTSDASNINMGMTLTGSAIGMTETGFQ